MKFHRARAEVFVPTGEDAEKVLKRTTHLAIAAHQDDIEIFAVHGVLECLHRADRSFCGAVVCDGRGSPSSATLARLDPETLAETRRQEQRRAARIGGYGAAVLLDFSSDQVKDSGEGEVVDDLCSLLRATRPEVLYTHSPSDRHETHVAVCLRVMSALSGLPVELRPRRVIGCEVWGDLDWLPRAHKVVMDVSEHEDIQSSLLEVFESQNRNGKRYDQAALGRRRAHATFDESHRVDQARGVVLGMDLKPVLDDPAFAQDPSAAVRSYVESLAVAFREEMSARLTKLA